VRCAVLLSAAGCGGSAGPKLVPVSGVVTIDGEPFPKANVAFHPDVSKGNKFPQYIPAGAADESGKYELVTTARKGAPEGWYKVVVIAPSPPPGAEAPKVGPPPFDRKFTELEQTDLSIEVKAGAPPGSYDLDLTK
jgi:hypothetical protein